MKPKYNWEHGNVMSGGEVDGGEHGFSVSYNCGTPFVTPFGHPIDSGIFYESQDQYSHEHNSTYSETTTKHRTRDQNFLEKYNTHAQTHKSTSDYTGVSHNK